jgi:hypothetical protein
LPSQLLAKLRRDASALVRKIALKKKEQAAAEAKKE